jgi:hypothetical protein
MLQNEYNHQFYEHQKLVLEVLFFLNQKDKKRFLPETSSIFLRINFSEFDKSSMMTTSKLLFKVLPRCENLYILIRLLRVLSLFVLFKFKIYFINSNTESVMNFNCSSSNSVCIGKEITWSRIYLYLQNLHH